MAEIPGFPRSPLYAPVLRVRAIWAYEGHGENHKPPALCCRVGGVGVRWPEWLSATHRGRYKASGDPVISEGYICTAPSVKAGVNGAQGYGASKLIEIDRYTDLELAAHVIKTVQVREVPVT